MDDAVLSLPQAQRCLAALAGLSYRGRTLADYLHSLCVQLTDLFGGGLAAVTLYRDGGKHVLAVAPGEDDLCTAYSPEGEVSTYVVQTGTPLRLVDGREDARFGRVPDGYASYMGVPLIPPDGQTIGTVCYFGNAPRRFSDAELDVAVLFAERAATAIDNFNLYQRLAQLNDNLQEQVAAQTAELRAAHERHVRQARLAAIGEFATAITHEIRTPLSTICLNLDSLARLPLTSTAQQRIALAHGEASRLERLLSELLVAAKPITLRRDVLDLGAFLPSVLASLQAHAAQRAQRFDVRAPVDAALVHADADKLTQVVINLARNACDAATPGSTIRWLIETPAASSVVRLRVCNDGEPIPADVLPRLTEPFFTTKTQGTGLGLMVVKSIVEAHGGELSISSSVEEGTVVTISMARWTA